MSDLIKREDAIELCAEAQGRASTKSELKGISKIWNGLKKLPSAEPKTGEWKIELFTGSVCSECGNTPYPFQTDSSEDDYWTPDYCPNCGAKMGSD